MNVKLVNTLLLQHNIPIGDYLNKLIETRKEPFRFLVDFGLPELPTEPGLLTIRGARQYGKSTWMEMKIEESYQQYGPGSSLYINAEELKGEKELYAVKNFQK